MSSASLTVWEGIDPNEAEGRLLSLRRRLADLEIALDHQQEFHKLHPNSFAVSLSQKSFDFKKEQLSSELAKLLSYRVNEPIKISLDGREYHDHSAGIGHLGLFLLRLQKLHSAVAQSMQTGPTLRGPVAAALSQATELRLSQVFPSSFGMELYVPSNLDLMGRSIASESLSGLFNLLSAGSDERRLMQASGALGGRVTNYLRHLVSYLSTSGSTIELSWSDYTGTTRAWVANQDLTSAISNNLKQIIQTRSDIRSFTGILGGVNIFRNSFELLVQSTGISISGTAVAGLENDLMKYFGKICTITAAETELLDRGSGESRTYYVLTEIRDSPERIAVTSDQEK